MTSIKQHRRSSLLLLGFLVFSSSSFLLAQERQLDGRSPTGAFEQAMPVPDRILYTGSQPFDVIHYDLNLNFAMTTGAMGGKVIMTIVPTKTLNSLTLNELGLLLDSLKVNGVPVTSGISIANEEFSFNLPSSAAAGESLSVAIWYRRPAGVSQITGRQGYYYFFPDSAGLRDLPDTLGYTMSEPLDARCWLPCYDEPWDKATLELRATVPAGFIAASNGVLLGTTHNADGTVTWHWRENHQIATYLIAVTISKWTVSTYPFVRSPGDTVPVQYFVWRPDSAACASYLPTVARMIGNLSTLFGPYPFDKYGMTGITPFAYGGMEHQSITTLYRGNETNESVVVHELGHQWWGDNVTCGLWQDIWLNESFASYIEALWKESLGGAEALRQFMVSQFEYFDYGSWQGAVYDPEGQGFGYFPQSVYSKGAWVLHGLRGVIGDSLFFASMRVYRARFQGGAAITEDFQDVVDSVSHRDMGWFFNEWIYGNGWPTYGFHWSSGGGTVHLTIAQLQDTTWPTYKMPIQIRALAPGKDTTFIVLDSLRVQSFIQPLSFAPDSIAFDPNTWILKQMGSFTTGVNSGVPGVPMVADLEQNYPNPFNPTTVISGQWSVTSVVRLAVYDILGREVAVVAHGSYPAGKYSFTFNASALSSGVYFYRLTAGSYTAVRKMLLIR